MIKFECNDEILNQFELRGSTQKLMLEYISLGALIHNAIKQKYSTANAKTFLDSVAKAFADADNTVWNLIPSADDDDDLSKGEEDDGAKIISFHPQ